MVPSRARALLALAALVLACAACSGASPGASAPGGTVTVLAASSLTDALERIAGAFEAEHDARVAVSFGASSVLAVQIVHGAPADVFVPADEASMAAVLQAGLVAGEPAVVATNELAIVVPAGNPSGIAGLADLAEPGLQLALCAPQAPCGRYAAEAFAAAGMGVPPASEESNVRGVLTKVALGEADAGLVYATDVRAAAGVEGVALDPAVQVRATYPAAVLADAPAPDAAAAFVTFLQGPAARRILDDAGFGAP